MVQRQPGVEKEQDQWDGRKEQPSGGIGDQEDKWSTGRGME